jgi:hypothetical protein
MEDNMQNGGFSGNNANCKQDVRNAEIDKFLDDCTPFPPPKLAQLVIKNTYFPIPQKFCRPHWLFNKKHQKNIVF